MNFPTVAIASDHQIFSTQMKNFLDQQRIGITLVVSADEKDLELADVIITDSKGYLTKAKPGFYFPEKDCNENFDNFDMPRVKVCPKGRFNKIAFLDSLNSVVKHIAVENEEGRIEKEYMRENSRLKEAQEERERDVSHIAQLQRELYTSSKGKLSTFRMFSTFRPHSLSKISGDVLFFKETAGKVFVMLSDVTNHGMFASFWGTTLYALSLSFVEGSPVKDHGAASWARWLMHTMATFRPQHPTPYLALASATTTLVVVDTQGCCAEAVLFGSGQEPPILVSDGNAEFFPGYEDCIFPPLSPELPNDMPVAAAKVGFHPGDMFVFYTDGVTELCAGKTEFSKAYSSEKVLSKISEILKMSDNLGPKKVVLSVLDDANSFSGNQSKKIQSVLDDITTAAFQWDTGR